MKIQFILLFGLVAAISSCTTAYRSGQTPDDVYYSPAPEQNSYVSSRSERDRNSYAYRNSEEAEIRRGIQNPVYRNSIAFDLGIGYGPFGYNNFYSPFGYNNFYSPYGYNSFYSPYGYNPYLGHSIYSPYSYSPYGYGSFYNPYSFYGNPYYGYGYPGYITSSRLNTNTGVRRYNLGAYNSMDNSPAAIRNAVRSNISSDAASPVRSFSSQPRSGSGNVIRRIFTPSESRSSSTRNANRTYNNRNENYNQRSERPSYEAPTRTFESRSSSPSYNNSSPSGSSNNSSAPVRSFRR